MAGFQLSGKIKTRIIWALFYCAVFTGSMVLYMKDTSFPYFYHMTEPSKIEQVQSGFYNLNHPLLMLNSGRLFVFLSGAETPQEIVEAGRLNSAVFSALTVVMLVWVAHLIAGPFAALGAGIILQFSPMMMRLSHYFKEDPTFLFGISLTFLAFAFYFRSPSVRRLIFAAFAAALAASGKYVGLILLPIGLTSVILFRKKFRSETGSEKSGLKQSLIFLGIYIAVIALVNYQVFFETGYIAQKMATKIYPTTGGSSTGLVALSGHGGVQVTRPWLEYVKRFFIQTHRIIPVLALVYLASFFISFKNRKPIEYFLVAFFFLFSILISLGKVASAQYFLPQEMLSHLFAVLGLLILLSPLYARISKKRFALFFVSAIIVLSVMLFPYLSAARNLHSEKYDTRRELAQWISSNIQSSKLIASESYIHLTQTLNLFEPEHDGKILEMEFAGDLLSLEDARRKGISYVAVCSNNYLRFFEKKGSPSAGSTGIYYQRRKFYDELFSQGKLLWEAKPALVSVVSKRIRLYSILDPIEGGNR